MPITFLDEVEEKPAEKRGITFINEPAGNPARANEILTNGILFNATPEQTQTVTKTLSPQDLEFETTKAYYDNKFGTNHTPSMIQAQIAFEYGDDATPQVANQMNGKAAKWHKKGMPRSIMESMARRTAAWTSEMPVIMSELSQFRDRMVSGVAEKIGLEGNAKQAFEAAFPRTPFDVAAKAYEKTEEMAPEIFDVMREFGRAQKTASDALRNPFMSGKSIEQAFMEKDWESIGQDVGTTIAFELPNLALQIGIGLFSGGASLGYMGLSAAGAKRADIADDDPLVKRVLNPIATGVVEAVTEKIGTGRIIDRIAAGKIKKSLARRFMDVIKDAAGGAVSEGTATFGENVIDRLSGEDAALAEGVILSTLVGAIMDAGVGLATTPMTYGDARRFQQQYSNEEIDAMVEEGVLTEKQGEAAKSPDEQAVEEANREMFEPREMEVEDAEKARQMREEGEIAIEEIGPEGEPVRRVPGVAEEVAPEVTSQSTDDELRAEAERLGIVFDGVQETVDRETGETLRVAQFHTEIDGKTQNVHPFGDETVEEALARTRRAFGEVVEPEAVTPKEQRIVKTPERAKDGTPLIVGISRAQNDEWLEAVGEAKLPEAERIRQATSVQDAVDADLHKNTDVIVEKANKGTPLKHTEVAALLVRKTELVNDIKNIQNRMDEAARAGDEELLAELGTELADKIDLGVTLTNAAAKGAEENARALAAMQMAMDRKSFDLVNVVSLAQSSKGEDLTVEERESLTEKVEELEALEKELEKTEKARVAGKDVEERLAILDEVERAHRRLRKKGRKKADVNADMKLIRKRQDRIFSLIDEINRGKPKGKKIVKNRVPDSEGYLDMIEVLQDELAEIRTERRLDVDIAKMEADIEAKDFRDYVAKPKTMSATEVIRRKRARKLALQREINRQIAALKPKTVSDWGWDIYDVFRGLRLTADAGHLLRQGGVVMSSPRMWVDGEAQRFFRESFAAFIKENADETAAAIVEDPDYAEAKQAGVAFIEEGRQLDAREEILIEGLINKIPIIGAVAKASGRVQIEGVNLMRLIAYKSYKSGMPNATMEDLKDVAFAINILTGRGEYRSGSGTIDRALNKLLTSPRFTASRFQAPVLLAMKRDGRYLWQNKPLRNRVIEDGAWFLGTRLALMYLISLALPDVEIGEDPDHWTFGRLIVPVGGGNVRVYNPWAGIQSAWRAIYPFAKGEIGFGEAVGRTLEGRKHPAISSIQEIRTGETFYGEDIGHGEALIRSLLPISVDGIREAIKKDTGVFDLITSVATDVIGVGSVLVDEDKLKQD